MVTDDFEALYKALEIVSKQGKEGGNYKCPVCMLGNLSENELHSHFPLYHTSSPHSKLMCPICNKICKPNTHEHINNYHGPLSLREPEAPDFAAFTWVVIQRESDGKFAMVNEPSWFAGGRPNYWLPAGRVDQGESFI